MQLTPNFRLRKPDGTDPVDVQDFNDNADVIDTNLAGKLDKTGDASNAVTKFTQAGSRANLTSGEKLSLSLGKAMKWFADLKTVAFSGSYSDLSGKPSIPSGTAASCGVANNDTTTASGFVADARIVKTHGDEIDTLNQNLAALNDGGAIKGMDARKDGVYITYVPTAGADAVTKKCSGVDKYNNVSGVRVSWREIYFNIAALRDDYQALSLDSICVQLLKISPNGQGNPVFNYSYNASTGRLTITTVSDMFGVITGMVANIWVSP